MISCYQDSDIFIPDELHGPLKTLGEIVPNTSKNLTLDGSSSHDIITTYNALIELEKGTFVNKNELQNSAFEFNLIELKSYADLILQNPYLEQTDVLYEHIHSVYFDASANGNSLDIMDGHEVVIRIPEREFIDGIALGRGYKQNGVLKWNFDLEELSGRLNYTSWEVVTETGQIEEHFGYSFSVEKSGWYTLGRPIQGGQDDRSICLNLQSDDWHNQNTIAFLLSKELKFITPLHYNGSHQFCSSKLNMTKGSNLKVVSVSEHSDGTLFYSEMPFELNEQNETIINYPEEVTSDMLKQMVLDL